ncbi:MAG: hypothetical protein NZL83_01330 [Candidatus Absconditabacterales bacterium]|nr:hypothetical protein [Candidatus Absconditabacterales bacterium]
MAQKMIVDGSGILYRCFFGMPALTDYNGDDTRVLFGTTKIILSLLTQNPETILIARDEKGPTIRHQEFDQYKATRPKIDPDLARQISSTKQLLAELGVPSCSQVGYEADDIIATYIATVRDHQSVTIVSADKDLKQLLAPHVSWQDPFNAKKLTDRDFLSEYGFKPVYFCDYLSLIGDVSDNIPGVAGIGPKTARSLIQTYETIENLYAHIDQIGGSIKTKLETNRDNAFLSKRLVTLRFVPDFDPEVARVTEWFDSDQWIRVLSQYGFVSLLDRVKKIQTSVEKQSTISGGSGGLFDI